MNKKFSVSQKDLFVLLSSMQPICNKRTTMDVTESILFYLTPRELTMKATDLEISLQANLDVESDLAETCGFLIPGKRIFELVKELEGTIDFEIKETYVRLRCLGVDLTLNIKETQEFPPFPERIENLMQIQSRFLLDMLNKVAFLIPQNNANPALNGMLLEIDAAVMTMVATDGHSLARVITSKYTLNEEKKWLIPKRAVFELKKLLEAYPDDNVFLGTCGNQLVFSGKNFNFFTKIIADPFPQYKPVMSKEDFILVNLAKDSFVKTLKRAGCLLAGQFVSTQFTFRPGTLQVSMQNKEVGALEEMLSLENFDGSNIESRFYSPYLLNGLQAFPDTSIQFYIKNNVKPIIFETEHNECCMTFLVMPVSITQDNQAG